MLRYITELRWHNSLSASDMAADTPPPPKKKYPQSIHLLDCRQTMVHGLFASDMAADNPNKKILQSIPLLDCIQRIVHCLFASYIAADNPNKKSSNQSLYWMADKIWFTVCLRFCSGKISHANEL